MAQVHTITFSNREECLEQIGKIYGNYVPRQPIPNWFKEFNEWFSEVSSTHKKVSGDSTINMMLRTEAFGWDDEECEEIE